MSDLGTSSQSAADTPSDLVTAAFERLRTSCKEQGYRLPDLQKPRRSRETWQGFDSKVAASKAAGIGRDVEEQASASETEREPVVRDRAGTKIPPSLLKEDGIRLYRKYDRRPKTLGSVLAQQVIRRGWQVHIAHGVIMTEWADLVGDVVAEHTRVVEFKDSVLVVECQSSAWATQLRLAQRTILAKIAERVGDGVVAELKLLGPKAPTWRKGKLHVKGRGPRDTYG